MSFEVLRCFAYCVLWFVCRLLLFVACCMLCGVVRCLLCVVVALLLFVVNGFVGVCCSLSACRCVMSVGLCRLLLELGIYGAAWFFVVRVCSVLRVVCCMWFANCC